MSDLIIISILNIVCFLIGAKVAQMMYKNKEIKMIPNPVKMVKEYKESHQDENFGDDFEALIADARYTYISKHYASALIRAKKEVAKNEKKNK